MTLRIGNMAGHNEVGAFFNDLAGVVQGRMQGVVGAPFYGAQYNAQSFAPPPPQFHPAYANAFQPLAQNAASMLNPFAYGVPSQRLIPGVPGAPEIGIKLQPLGLGVVTFTATSGTALPATTRPQKPFKGKRLIVDVARTGTTSTGLLTITSITIGVNNQFVSTGAVGAGAFAAGAFDANVELSACSTALDITVNYALSAAPTTTDTVAVSTTLFGETVGS